MKFSGVARLTGAVTMVFALQACAEEETAAVDAEATAPVVIETDEEKASYGIGYAFTSNLIDQTQGIELSMDALIQGVRDAMTEADMTVSDEEVQAAVGRLQQKQLEAQQAEAEAASSANRAEGETFLAENGEKEGIVTTESGLQYEILERSDSEERPTAESTVSVHYHGTLINGTVFDSSVERGQPVEFPLGNVIAGWTEGVQLMAVGDKFRFFIPADLAYGDRQPSPDIPSGSTLIFEVELLEIL